MYHYTKGLRFLTLPGGRSLGVRQSFIYRVHSPGAICINGYQIKSHLSETSASYYELNSEGEDLNLSSPGGYSFNEQLME